MMRAGKDYITKDLGVEVITAYENKIVGQVIYPPGLLRDALVRSGRVKRRVAPVEPLPIADETHEDIGRARAMATAGRRPKPSRS